MHELFTQVLTYKDLSKAGDLFNVPDSVIVDDLTEVINRIREIASLPEYTRNDNDQSVVEICITRVTSAIRESHSIEKHAEALVALLQICLNHNLRPSTRDHDPPHAKIASDVVSCIFLNYGKRDVMALALPVAVKFLHKGNRELSRNMSSYLSLAAIEAADLLSLHTQPIIDSVISGNYSLSRVLPQIYAVKKEPIHDHVMTLVSLLPQCDTNEKLGLLMLFSLVAKNRPALLEPSLPQLVECLSVSGTCPATLQIFVDLCSWRPAPFAEHITRLKGIVEHQPHCLPLALQVISAVGRLGKEKAKAALEYIAHQLPKVETAGLALVLREVQILCGLYPSLLVESEMLMIAVSRCLDRANPPARVYIQQLTNEYNEIRNSNAGHNPSASLIIKVGGAMSSHTANGGEVIGSGRPDLAVFQPSVIGSGRVGPKYQKYGDSRLVTSSNRSMPRLNITKYDFPHSQNRLGSSSIQLTKSTNKFGSYAGLPMNRSVTVLAPPSRHLSSQMVVATPCHNGSSRLVSGTSFVPAMHSGSPIPGSNGPVGKSMSSSISALRESGPGTGHLGEMRSSSSGGVLGGPSSPFRSQSNLKQSLDRVSEVEGSLTRSSPRLGASKGDLAPMTAVSELASKNIMDNHHLQNSQSPLAMSVPLSRPVSPATAVFGNNRNTASVNSAIPSHDSRPIFSSNNVLRTSYANNNTHRNNKMAGQRISVFEPIAMRDTVQHFCEKHLDKIKAYMLKVFVRLPLPIRCGIEERKNRKHAKLYFVCQGKGDHCLYSKHFFTMKTRNPRVWIHLMFLALQARSMVALSTRETQVGSLKNCWDILKSDALPFVTLVTSAFPSPKDMDMLMHELRNARFFDVFEYNGPEQQWGCFLCNHPERAQGFMEENTPVIEGQLKEKKSKWMIFRKWRTRYFTLSGAHLSYRGSKEGGTNTVEEKGDIEVQQIRSVKVNRGGRNIPKAFEIFTENKSFVLKAKDSSNAEEWVRCLSIAVAHSHSQGHTASRGSTSIPRNFMYGNHMGMQSRF